MLRNQISEALKTAMKEKDNRSMSTLRLILAAVKDRDISARTKGNHDGINDTELLSLLQSMIKQRRESIDLYNKGGRKELAQQELEEISVINSFLPIPLSEKEAGMAVCKIITETGAKGIKDMGKVMSSLKKQFAGRMDFSKASQVVKKKLE